MKRFPTNLSLKTVLALLGATAFGGVHAATSIIQDDNSGTSAASTYIRSDHATTNYDSASMVIGTTTSAQSRGLLSFDLSALPAGATITSVTLTFFSALSDSGSSNSDVTFDLLLLTTAFTASEATWNIATSTTNWATPGGDFNTSDLLSSVSVNPNTLTNHEVITFATSSNFVSAAQSALKNSQPLQFIVKLKNETAVRNIIYASNAPRFYPELTVEYTAAP